MLSRSQGTAIVINLDYDNISRELGQVLWAEIEYAMLSAGFGRDNRVFTHSDEDSACELASSVLRELEPRFAALGVCQLDAIREFYSYPLGGTVNLFLQDTSGLVIQEVNEARLS